VLGPAAAAVDVTDRGKARARKRVLDAARESVGRTLDVAVTCQELVDIVVPDFADIAIVEVVDSAMRGDEPPLCPLPPEVLCTRSSRSPAARLPAGSS
jgi:hypothetical protein